MAQQHHRFTAAGARLVGVSVDSVGQNAAMVDKLGLPFPLLSDPDGTGAIQPYGVWHPEPKIARPAAVLVAPGGRVVYRRVGSDFADRPTEDELLDQAELLDLPASSQPPPRPGDPHPGDRAVDLGWLPAYLRGAKFAATALGMRLPEAAGQVEVLTAEYDRYMQALKQRKAQGHG